MVSGKSIALALGGIGFAAVAAWILSGGASDRQPEATQERPLKSKQNSIIETRPGTDSAFDASDNMAVLENRPDVANSAFPANEGQSDVAASTVMKALKRLPAGSLDDLRKDFAAELVDPVWASAAEVDITRKFETKIAGKDMGLVSREIECRFETCRVMLAYSAEASETTERDELIKVGEPVSQMVRDIAQGDSLVTGALVLHRGGFAGEPVTTEIFLTRRGFKQVMDFWMTPGSASRSK